MALVSLVQFCVLNLLISILTLNKLACATVHEAPCSYFETVNVTGNPISGNGSYLHSGVFISPDLVAPYDYIYRYRVNKTAVEPHQRGCICQLKPCLNFCCRWGYKYDVDLHECVQASPKYNWPQPFLNVTFHNGTEMAVNISEKFVMQDQRPCKKMVALTPEIDERDSWKLLEDGSIVHLQKDTILARDRYCFGPLPPLLPDDHSGEYGLHVIICPEQTEFKTVKSVMAYGMFLSIFFMVLTVVVYLSLPELRNLCGKCLISYLIGLIIGYSTLTCHAFIPNLDVFSIHCKLMGYTAYFFFITAFLWLNVISFDVWREFSTVKPYKTAKSNKKFLKYVLYVWSVALVLTALTCLAGEVSFIPEIYKPGIGGGQFCWIEMRTWSAMIYFFGPMLIITLINTVLFILTAMSIRSTQQEIGRILGNTNTSTILQREKNDKFLLFLRLFLIMGVTWTVEIISYLTGWEKNWAKFFYFTDFINAIQGVLIFVLFVVKKSTRKLVVERYRPQKRKSHNKSLSSISTTLSGLVEYKPDTK